jgi:ceramide glucosyltransferase
LKPIKGIDPEAYQNFVSFCEQDYPDYEVLFGVADGDDPAVDVIEQAQRVYPDVAARLVVGASRGANRKVGILQRLVAEARFEHLAISDSDIRVGHDYLRRIVHPLAAPEVGLVTCPYKAAGATSVAAKLAALHMGVTFLPSVCVARLVLRGFAMGSTVVVRRSELRSIGGFAGIADHLADDYEIGARIARAGKRAIVSDYVVDTIVGKPTLLEQWHREIRWVRCTRVSRPLEYPGLVLSLSTPLALFAVLATGFAPIGWWLLAGSLALRWLIAWLVTDLTEDWQARRALAWLPVRDVLSGVVWCSGFVGHCVRWRGEQYVLCSDGTMTPRDASAGRLRPRRSAAPDRPSGRRG